MKKKCRVYKKTGNTPKHLQNGGPAMTQDSQPDPVYEQRNANFLDFLKTTSQDAIVKQQLDQQKEMARGYAQDGQEEKDKKDGTYIPEYLDKGNNTRPGAKMNDYGYLDNSNMNAFIGDYNNSRPDWGGSFFGLLGAANKTKKNMFKMELEDGQTQQNFFKDPTDIDYDQTTLDKLDFTGYKKAGKRGKDRVLSYTAEGTSKYIPGQRQKAWDASKGILDVARKEGDLNPTPGSQDGGQPSPEEMAMMQAQQAQAPQEQAPQQPQQQTDEIIGQVQQALESGAQPQEVMMQLLQSGMPPESVAQVFIQLGMPQEQVVQAIEQVMAQGQEQQPSGQPSEEEMMAMQQQQMGAPAPPMMQTGGEDPYSIYNNYQATSDSLNEYADLNSDVIKRYNSALKANDADKETQIDSYTASKLAKEKYKENMSSELLNYYTDNVETEPEPKGLAYYLGFDDMERKDMPWKYWSGAGQFSPESIKPPQVASKMFDNNEWLPKEYDGGQLYKAQDGDEYGQGANRDGNNMYGSRDYSNNPMNQMGTTHGYMDFLQNINAQYPKQQDDEQVTEDGDIYLKKQGRFKQAWNDNANFGQNTNNLMQMATNIGNLGENKQKKLDAKERMSNVHRRFAVGPQDRGDYATNAFGYGDNLKMDQKTRMGYDTKVAQDGMQVNDEMELTEEQINQLISQGYQLEYLD
jgi:hypothetical protein